MFRSHAIRTGTLTNRESIDLCQRVFYHACAQKRVMTKQEREALAVSIIHDFCEGLTDERDLRRAYVGFRSKSVAMPLTATKRRCVHELALHHVD